MSASPDPIEELLCRDEFENLWKMQLGFDQFRSTYNHERPHEALGLTVPAKRYLVSDRIYPERLPPIEYPSSMAARCVSEGWLSYKGRHIGSTKLSPDIAWA